MASQRHHLRAQEILASLDAARSQRTENERSRNSVLDAEDVLAELHEQLFVRKMHKDIENANKTAAGELDRFERELDYGDTTRRHNEQRYMQECSLEVPVAKLTTEDAVPNLRTVNYAFAQLEQMQDHHGTGARQLGGFIQRAEDAFSTVERLVESMRIENDPWYNVLQPVMGMLQRLLEGRSAGEPCMDIDDEVDKLAEKEENLEGHQDEATQEGDLAKAQVLSGKRITLLEGIVDLVTHKFGLLDAEQESFVDTLRSEVTAQEDEARGEISVIRQQLESRKKAIQSDLTKLGNESTKADSDENIARSYYLKEKERSDQILSKNHSQQEQLWKQMHELEDQLVDLARERRQEIDSRIKLLEREERRRVDMSHFTDFVTSHTQLLQLSLRTCEAEETVATKLENVIGDACHHVHDCVQFFEKELTILKGKCLMEHFTYFRRQYLLLGDCLYKRDRYADELSKKIDLEAMQQHLRMEALDPAARVHAQQRDALEKERASVLADVELFKQKADLYVAAFKPTEMALLASGRAFVHPVQELIDINKKKGRSMAEFHGLMVSEVDLLDPKRIRATPQEIESELKSIAVEQELVRAAKAKKSNAGTQREDISGKMLPLLRSSSSMTASTLASTNVSPKAGSPGGAGGRQASILTRPSDGGGGGESPGAPQRGSTASSTGSSMLAAPAQRKPAATSRGSGIQTIGGGTTSSSSSSKQPRTIQPKYAVYTGLTLGLD